MIQCDQTNRITDTKKFVPHLMLLDDLCAMEILFLITLLYSIQQTFTRKFSKELNIEFWQSEPYIYYNKDGKLDGYIPKYLNNSHWDGKECGPDGVKINFLPAKKTHLELLASLDGTLHAANATTNSSENRIYAWAPILPSHKVTQITHTKNNMIVIMESPGYTLIANELTQNKIYRVWVFGMTESFTLLVMSLLFTIAAGIIIWLVERKEDTNKGDFAYRFIPGAWDGIWWAAVTLTTVGYGDKTPKTVLGRIVGILWLILSCILLASFGAILTSSVTAETVSIAGKQIAHVEGLMAKDVIEEKSGVPVAVKTYKEAINLAKGMKVYGALIETNHIASKQAELYKDHSIIVDQKFHNQPIKIKMMIPKIFLNGTSQCFISLKEHLEKHSKHDQPKLKSNPYRTLAEQLRPSARPIALSFTISYVFLACFIILGVLAEIIAVIKKRQLNRNQKVDITTAKNGQLNSDSDTLLPQLCNKIETMNTELQNIRSLVQRLQQNADNSKKNKNSKKDAKIHKTSTCFSLQEFGSNNDSYVPQEENKV